MPKEDKTKRAFEMIEQGVTDVFSSDNYKKYLTCCSRFHNYSTNNTLLILAQKPDATLVAGYQSWQKNFNRHVNRGEKGLFILAPVTNKIIRLMDKADENGNPILDKDGNPVKEERVVNQLNYTVTTVFDISQTSGDPLPSLLHTLSGSSDEILAFIDTVYDICTIPIDYASAEKDSVLAHGAKGYYSPSQNRIVVNMELEDMQIAKTLIHEYAHSILHRHSDKDSDQKEIEAESLAFVLCDHFGIDTSEYSFGYIAGYSAEDPSRLKSILNDIQSTAHQLIDQMEPLFEDNLRKRTMAHEYISPVDMDDLCNDLLIQVTNTIRNADEQKLEDTQLYQAIDSHLYESFQKDTSQLKIQEYLYSNHKDFRNTLKQMIFQECRNDDYNPYEDHPFISQSRERANYELFASIASPVLNNEALYIQYGAMGMKDLHIEVLDDNRFVMARSEVINGDLCSDPRMEIRVDQTNRLLYPETWQMDSMEVYQQVQRDPIKVPQMGRFLNEWMTGIQENSYKVKAVYCQNECFESSEDIRRFCKEHNLAGMAPKPREKER